MDQKSSIQIIDSVFEEKLCISGHYSVDKFTSLTDTFIKYKNELISLMEIFRETLCFEPSGDSWEICEECKNKLQEFYKFKRKSQAARNVFSTTQQMKVPDNPDEKSIEHTMLEIIRNYIKTYSIKSIEIREETKTFLVLAGKEEPAVESNTEETEDLGIEYLEEFLDDSVNSDDTRMEHNEVNHEEIIESPDQELSSSDVLKRSKNPEEWACNKRKKLRNSGKSYVNSKGRVVSERKMGESCATTNCRNNCHLKISENDRLSNFSKFWSLGDIVEQRKFIYSHILSKEPTRRKKAESNRSVTLQFYLDTKDLQGHVTCVQVCKKMFKNTLAISNQVIQGVVSKYSKTAFQDPRGKHKRKITEAQKLAQDHVEKFPFFYVEHNMTKVQLYNMYVEDCKKISIEPVKESNYREIFDKFNANNFLKAEKIVCEICHRYYKATEQERYTLQKEHNEHLETDKKCRDRALARIRHRRSMEKRKTENS